MTDKELKTQVLESWPVFNKIVLTLPIRDLERCVELELAGERRRGILHRLTSRICRIERSIKFEALETRLHV